MDNVQGKENNDIKTHGRSRVDISAWTPAILTDIFNHFLSLEANAGVVP
jgi:hypothetical protein